MRRTALALTALLLAAPAAAAPATAAATRTVTFPGSGAVVTLDHLDRLDRISRTAPDFSAFVERRLTRLWQANDPREECRTAATMIVKRWRSDGFALISDMGNFAPCPDGGYVQIAVRDDDGRWRTPTRLGTQEVYRCRVLEAFDVPAAVTPGRECYDGRQVVTYAG